MSVWFFFPRFKNRDTSDNRGADFQKLLQPRNFAVAESCDPWVKPQCLILNTPTCQRFMCLHVSDLYYEGMHATVTSLHLKPGHHNTVVSCLAH